MSVNCSRVVVPVQEPAPVVLWEIKTFRGANELFGSSCF